jgi:hypothetical protein
LYFRAIFDEGSYGYDSIVSMNLNDGTSSKYKITETFFYNFNCDSSVNVYTYRANPSGYGILFDKFDFKTKQTEWSKLVDNGPNNSVYYVYYVGFNPSETIIYYMIIVDSKYAYYVGLFTKDGAFVGPIMKSQNYYSFGYHHSSSNSFKNINYSMVKKLEDSKNSENINIIVEYDMLSQSIILRKMVGYWSLVSGLTDNR